MPWDRETEMTQLLADLRDGDRAAFEKLASLLYPELRRLAHLHLSRELGAQRFSTTELVHEVYVRLADEPLPEWKSRVHFFGTIARLVRRILVDEARERKAQKRGSGLNTVSLDELRDFSEQPPPSVLALHEAMNELEKSDPRKAHILELRYFGGLEGEEIAAIVDVSPSTVARELRVAKAWVKTYLTH